MKLVKNANILPRSSARPWPWRKSRITKSILTCEGTDDELLPNTPLGGGGGRKDLESGNCSHDLGKACDALGLWCDVVVLRSFLGIPVGGGKLCLLKSSRGGRGGGHCIVLRGSKEGGHWNSLAASKGPGDERECGRSGGRWR